jgi:hypothetical protein
MVLVAFWSFLGADCGLLGDSCGHPDYSATVRDAPIQRGRRGNSKESECPASFAPLQLFSAGRLRLKGLDRQLRSAGDSLPAAIAKLLEQVLYEPFMLLYAANGLLDDFPILRQASPSDTGHNLQEGVADQGGGHVGWTHGGISMLGSLILPGAVAAARLAGPPSTIVGR